MTHKRKNWTNRFVFSSKELERHWFETLTILFYAAAIIASIFENLKKKRKSYYSLVVDVKIQNRLIYKKYFVIVKFKYILHKFILHSSHLPVTRIQHESS
jgi:hypothetical protein